MLTRIRSIDKNCSIFENILPEELLYTKITDELKTALDEINKIFGEDSQYIQKLAARVNKVSMPTSPTLVSLIKWVCILERISRRIKSYFIMLSGL